MRTRFSYGWSSWRVAATQASSVDDAPTGTTTCCVSGWMFRSRSSVSRSSRLVHARDVAFQRELLDSGDVDRREDHRDAGKDRVAVLEDEIECERTDRDDEIDLLRGIFDGQIIDRFLPLVMLAEPDEIEVLGIELDRRLAGLQSRPENVIESRVHAHLAFVRVDQKDLLRRTCLRGGLNRRSRQQRRCEQPRNEAGHHGSARRHGLMTVPSRRLVVPHE